MRYFQSMGNDLFSNGFIRYVDKLREEVADEYALSYSDMLDLFNQLYEKDLSIEFSVRCSGLNQTYVRTLYYALALDESMRPGFSPNKFKFDQLFGGFEGDYMSRENYNIDDVFYSLGAGGLPYAFATKKTEDARQLGHMLYQFAWGFEHQFECDEDKPWSEKLEQVVALGTRLGILDSIENLDEVNTENVKIPNSLRATMTMDFHLSSPAFKQELISTMLGEIARIDEEFHGLGKDLPQVDIMSLACNWSIELGRCLLLINKPVEFVIEKVTELFDSVLSCDQNLSCYHDILLNHTLRSSFFHYPQIYQSVFQSISENYQFIDYNHDDKGEKNVARIFSDEHLPFKELTRPQNLLSDNEMLFRAALGHGIFSAVDNLPYRYNLHNIYKFARFNMDYDGGVFKKALVNMLDRFNVSHLCNGYDSSLHEMELDIVRIDDPLIYDAYNSMLVRADASNFKFDARNDDIGLLFSNGEHRKMFLNKLIIDGELTANTAKLGAFSMEEMRPHWHQLPDELKRDVLSHEMGM